MENRLHHMHSFWGFFCFCFFVFFFFFFFFSYCSGLHKCYKCRRNKIHAKAKKTGSGKLRTKFESLRREIKAGIKKQHDLNMN